MLGPLESEFRSGDPLFTFDAEMRVLSWNRAAEELTGIPADEALGRPCWQVLAGTDESGSVYCHAGCSGFRLASEGWPVRPRAMLVKSKSGPLGVTVSTIAHRTDPPTFVHLLTAAPNRELPEESSGTELTPRRREVLSLLAEGVPAKQISARLGIAETTVRNHIRTIRLQLDCHSQLEAVAEARRRGLV
jgi:DNA-binding CsgD family transcriptional regulator